MGARSRNRYGMSGGSSVGVAGLAAGPYLDRIRIELLKPRKHRVELLEARPACQV